VYGCMGAGVMGETGNETGSLIDHNFVASSYGSNEAIYIRLNKDHGADDIGHEGSCFWFKGVGYNTFTNNVGANASADAFTLGNLDVGMMKVPLFKGADPNVEGQYKTINGQETPVAGWDTNEGYGMMDRALRPFDKSAG